MNCGESIRVVHPLFQTEGGGSTPTSPLQFHIGKIHWRIARNLNEMWHSRFPVVPKPETHNPCFGAEFGGKFYAVAMWGQPIAANRLTNGFNRLELRRFAIAPDAPKNTASRMLAVMVRLIRNDMPTIVGLLSYQDAESHTGCIYKASGWKCSAKSNNSVWDRPGRRVPLIQSSAPKLRWELPLCQK